MAHHGLTQIQQHSVGPVFPFVIFRKEEGGCPQWGFEGAGFHAYPYNSHAEATQAAAELKASGLTIGQARHLEAQHWDAYERQLAYDVGCGL